MPLNYHETSDNVFLSEEPLNKDEWNTIIDIGVDRGRPVAVMDFRAGRLPCDMIVCQEGWMNLHMPIPDAYFDINADFSASDFFRSAGATAKTLHDNGYIIWMHCHMGISRSTSANISYRMQAFKESRDIAFDAIKQVRPHVHPNGFFWKALLDLEEELFGKVISNPDRELKYDSQSLWLPPSYDKS